VTDCGEESEMNEKVINSQHILTRVISTTIFQFNKLCNQFHTHSSYSHVSENNFKIVNALNLNAVGVSRLRARHLVNREIFEDLWCLIGVNFNISFSLKIVLACNNIQKESFESQSTTLIYKCTCKYMRCST
jgi:hypothetical protein